MNRKESLQYATRPELPSFPRWESTLHKTVFSRHGKTRLNEQGLLQGTTDAPLSDNGRRAMEAIAKKLASQNLGITTIISSPMQRASSSAEIMGSVLKIPQTAQIERSELSEFNMGDLEGMEIRALNEDEQHNDWLLHPISLSGTFPAQAESFLDFLKRINTGMKIVHDKVTQGEKPLVVSHAMVSRGIRFLAYLSQEGVTDLDYKNVVAYENNFFHNLNTHGESFLTVPHDVFKIDADSFVLSEVLS